MQPGCKPEFRTTEATPASASARAKFKRPRGQASFRLVQATGERHLSCPGADANQQRCWRATDGNVSETGRKAGDHGAKPAAAREAAPTSPSLGMKMPEDRETPACIRNAFPKAWASQHQVRTAMATATSANAQAHLGKERRARQTERRPADSENKLCRGENPRTEPRWKRLGE